ncbi:MAG: hypothetical protein PVF70_10595 [Anaerolineales bacterium]|jgi:hypothetical protein
MKRKLALLAMLVCNTLALTVCALVEQEAGTQATEAVSGPGMEPSPDYSRIVVLESDLRPGFESVGPDYFGIEGEQASEDDWEILNECYFMEPDHLHFVMALLYLLPTEFDKASFDAALSDPDILMGLLFSEFSDDSILEPPRSIDIEVLGEASVFITAVVDSEGAHMRADNLVLRKGEVGVLLSTIYMAGDSALADLEEIGRILIGRIDAED